MATSRPPAEYVVERGEQIYEHELRNQLEPANIGRYVAIDINTSKYRVGDDRRTTVHTFLSEHPDAVIYTKLIGFTAAAAIRGRMQQRNCSVQDKCHRYTVPHQTKYPRAGYGAGAKQRHI